VEKLICSVQNRQELVEEVVEEKLHRSTLSEALAGVPGKG